MMKNTYNPNRESEQENLDKIDNAEAIRGLILEKMQDHFERGDDTYLENLKILEEAFYIKKRIQDILDNKQ